NTSIRRFPEPTLSSTIYSFPSIRRRVPKGIPSTATVLLGDAFTPDAVIPSDFKQHFSHGQYAEMRYSPRETSTLSRFFSSTTTISGSDAGIKLSYCASLNSLIVEIGAAIAS